MSIGDKDDSTFVGDGFLSRNGGKSSPFFEVKGHVSVGDQSMTFAVGAGADEEPTEHCVAAVPLLSLDGRPPAPFGKRRELLLPVGSGIFIDSWVQEVSLSSA